MKWREGACNPFVLQAYIRYCISNNQWQVNHYRAIADVTNNDINFSTPFIVHRIESVENIRALLAYFM